MLFFNCKKRQYLNCRGDGGDVSPHRELGVPPTRFERWMIRKKNLQNPVKYSTKFRGKSDSERKTLQPSAKTFFIYLFFGLHLILAKKHLDSPRRPFLFWSLFNFVDGIT